MKKNFLFIFILSFITPFLSLAQQKKAFSWSGVRVLVYTKNGKGYVHDNIPSAVACVQKLGKEYGFKVDVSDTAVVFTKENLKKYKLLIFTSTNNDVFDTDAQRLAFRQYIEAGGGFVGVHSVVGTERNWTWFKQMLGGTFSWHAHFQKYRVKVFDKAHPSVRGLPLDWEKEDECYFEKEMYPGIRTLMVQDVKSLVPNDDAEKEKIKQNNGSFGDYYPAVWYQNFDGGLIWVTTLGHDKKDYADPTYMKHLLQGIQFVAERIRPLDWKKAYATDRNTPLK